MDYLSLLRLLHHIPMVVSTHGGFFHTHARHRFQKILFQQTVTRKSLGRVGAVVCVSESMIGRNVSRDRAPLNRIRVIENGADIDRFCSLRKKVEPGLVLGISRLAENKRVNQRCWRRWPCSGTAIRTCAWSG